jgi:exodeoxyribonuclease V alpha subunit
MTFDDLPLGPFERAFCASLQRLDPQASLNMLACAALCCQALARGDVCLPLGRVAGQQPWPETPLRLPECAALLAELRDSRLIGAAGAFRPLILDGTRLYLARYEAYERQLAEQLLARSTPLEIDEAALRNSLDRLFAGNTQRPDWQRLAAAQAVRNRVSIVSGGPGTGKTTTVVRLLAALLEQGGADKLAIGLAAPTGKAAARMAEAIRNAREQLPVDEEIKAQLPEQARTLHRLLGAHGDSPRVRYHAANPLPLDVLVVDEASMIDLAMMAKLVDALPTHARLILLGDKDQLCAVEAGAVFAELCEGRGFDAGSAQALERLTGQPVPVEAPRSRLGSQVLLLSHSHRFDAHSGIGHLARSINAGELEATRQVLAMDYPDLIWNQHPSAQGLQQRMAAGYADYLGTAQGSDPAAAFAAFNRFRVLCAQREGPWGVETLNEALETRLRRQFGAQGRWYPGRAVMVSHNDYGLGLFNGDIGLCLASGQGLRVFFEAEDGVRHFSTARLPAHEPAFAMTVHKSQGSEFEQVLLALPEQPSPLLNRSLIYTGITRAKRSVELWAIAERLADAVRNRSERAAGLAERLGVTAEPQSCAAPSIAPQAGGDGQLSLF